MFSCGKWIEFMYYIFFTQFLVLLYNTFIFTSSYQLDGEEEQDFTHFLGKLYNKIIFNSSYKPKEKEE